jgi:HSP20 family protein
MKDRRSFFEKLTGGVRVDDTPESEEVETRSPAQAAAGDAWYDDAPEEGQLTVDVYQNASEIIVKTMVAGVKPEDLDISITRDMVTIKGSRETDTMVADDDYFHRELYWGTFSREIMLPAEVEVEEAEAVEKHGLLIIKLPKIDKHKQTKLKVRG